MACSIPFLLPAAYWYAAFYAGRPDHFEAAALAAVNSGGNNMARAALTGALVGLWWDSQVRGLLQRHCNLHILL
jgi:ADP-ribosylglycohydrolase